MFNLLLSRTYRRLLGLVCLTLFTLGITLHLPARSQVTDALTLAREGQQLYNERRLSRAAELWQQAAEAYQLKGDRQGATKSLINKSQALQELGLYPKACNTLLAAFDLAFPNCSDEQLEQILAKFNQDLKPDLNLTEGIGLRSLGEVLRRQGRLELAQKILEASWLATKFSEESGATLLSMGNVAEAMGNRNRDRADYEEITEIIDRQSPEIALETYQQAFAAYERATSTKSATPLTKLQAQLNHLSLLLDIRQWWQQQTDRRIESWSRLNMSGLTERATNFLSQLEARENPKIQQLTTQIQANITDLPPSHRVIYAQINFAQSLIELEQTAAVETILNRAWQQAHSLQDRRAETYALGYLGQWYGQQGNLERAIAITRQALILAQAENLSGDAREATYLWESQLGSLLRRRENKLGALAAYTAAFNTLQSLRNDLNINDRVVRFDFNQEVRPVYLELADLLLSNDFSSEELNSLVVFNPTATNTQLATKTPLNLELARRIIESLQLAELDNFFQDPCSEITDIAVQIDDIDPEAAVIYPIVLPDRIEVIVSLPGKPLTRATVAIAETEVNQTLNQLYDTLYNKSVDNSAVNIFRTIPLNPGEVNDNIQKLLPIFQQVYGWLIQPFENDFAANQIQTLVFVLNGRLQRVPMAALYDGQKYLLEKYSVALVPSLQLTDSRLLKRQQLKVLAAGVNQQVEVRGEIFPALDNVVVELNQIEQAFPASKQLLNEEFTVTEIQEQLKADFSAIHLATHGLFSSDPEKTFIITGDRQTLGIDRLSDIFNSSALNSPELMVLSACETATGDERAILGLAGVTVRSGTRSTLATLWSVDDASTAELMGQFYQEYKNPEVKKTTALQKAQLSLLKSLQVNSPSPELQGLPPHPYYWAPYVLVGNWQ